MEFANEESLHKLRRLAARESSYVSRVEHTMHLGMMPSCIGRMRTSVSQILNDKLRKYDQTLDGIIVGYENVKLVGGVGHAVINSSLLHVNIHALFYVFRPRVDVILSGVVVKCSGLRATCMLHDVFTVFVSLDEALRSLVRPSAVICFRVTEVDLCAAIPLVIGHMDPDIWQKDVSESRQEELQSPADSGVSCNEEESSGPFLFGVAVAPILPQSKYRRQLNEKSQKRDGQRRQSSLNRSSESQHIRFPSDGAPTLSLPPPSGLAASSISSTPSALPAADVLSVDCFVHDRTRMDAPPETPRAGKVAGGSLGAKKRRRQFSPVQQECYAETVTASLPSSPTTLSGSQKPSKRRKHGH